jgi:hypothetical protein
VCGCHGSRSGERRQDGLFDRGGEITKTGGKDRHLLKIKIRSRDNLIVIFFGSEDVQVEAGSVVFGDQSEFLPREARFCHVQLKSGHIFLPRTDLERACLGKVSGSMRNRKDETLDGGVACTSDSQTLIFFSFEPNDCNTRIHQLLSTFASDKVVWLRNTNEATSYLS